MVKSWQELAELGYGQFAANPFRAGIDTSSSEESCDAELYYGAADTRIYGSSGGGHAEMNALELFLKNHCMYNAATFGNAFPISIFCEEKPCCYYCSAMMGLLGIVARTSATRKVKSRMGKTQWGGLSLTSLEFVDSLIGQPKKYLMGWDGSFCAVAAGGPRTCSGGVGFQRCAAMTADRPGPAWL